MRGADDDANPTEPPKRSGFQPGRAKTGGRQKGSKNRKSLERQLEAAARDLFAVPGADFGIVGSPKQLMEDGMRFFARASLDFLKEARRLELAGDRRGALEAWQRSERARIASIEAAARLAPYCHARLESIPTIDHDASTIKITIEGGIPDNAMPAPPKTDAPPPAAAEAPMRDFMRIELNEPD
jgi:hypothetical protein